MKLPFFADTKDLGDKRHGNVTRSTETRRLHEQWFEHIYVIHRGITAERVETDVNVWICTGRDKSKCKDQRIDGDDLWLFQLSAWNQENMVGTDRRIVNHDQVGIAFLVRI